MRDEIVAKLIDTAGDPLRLVHYLARLLKDPRVPQTAKLKLLGSGLYAWIDGDIIPDEFEKVPGLGYVDDIILLVHGVKCLIAETEPAVAAELWPGDEASFKRVLTAVSWVDKQLFERARGFASKILDKITGGARNKPPKPA